MKTTLSVKALLRECRPYVASEPMSDIDRNLLARIDRALGRRRMTCSICKGEIEPQGTWLSGHNADPVNQGRCCDTCNSVHVIPARLRLMAASR